MTSKPLYIYLQRPDNSQWVTVGRYQHDETSHQGDFLYAPSYVEAGLSWSIDPVNLPLIPHHSFITARYKGLHDVLRDATPDFWGRQIIQREYNLPSNSHDSKYLLLAGNTDRWGALAIGTSKKPNIAQINTPKIDKLEALTQELLAVAEHRPPVHTALRKRLLGTPSLGGARPKTTIRDGETFWLVKPYFNTDTADIPLLEHVCSLWGTAKWSYPRLAQELLQIGAPPSDQLELFNRMVFNAIIGNDDDHPRNHAVLFHPQEMRWRLSPAFDVVPNPDETPRKLAMQLSTAQFNISRHALLADHPRFGFQTTEQAQHHLDELLQRVQTTHP
jgi:serine/threonine-protein kinase HipA